MSKAKAFQMVIRQVLHEHHDFQNEPKVFKKRDIDDTLEASNESEWTKCQAKTLDPKRKEFKIPPEFRQNYDFLKLYKSKVGQRVIPNNPSTVKKEENGTSNNAHFPLKGTLHTCQLFVYLF